MKYWVARSSTLHAAIFKVKCLEETAAGRLKFRYSGEPLGLYKARRADATVSSAGAHGMKTRFHKFRSSRIPALTIQDYAGPYLACQAPASHSSGFGMLAGGLSRKAKTARFGHLRWCDAKVSVFSRALRCCGGGAEAGDKLLGGRGGGRGV